MIFNKEQILEIIDAICDECGQNAEMIAEMMEDNFNLNYDEDEANQLLAKMKEVLKANINLLSK